MDDLSNKTTSRGGGQTTILNASLLVAPGGGGASGASRGPIGSRAPNSPPARARGAIALPKPGEKAVISGSVVVGMPVAGHPGQAFYYLTGRSGVELAGGTTAK